MSDGADPQLEPQLRIVPGLGLDARSWAPTLRQLHASVQVVLLPGYGISADAGTDLSPARLAERLLAGLEHPAPAVLAGHSSGCQVAAHVAASRPDLVSSLVLVGPTTDPRGRGWPDLAWRWLRTAAREDPRQVPELARQYAATRLRVMARAMEAARWDSIRDVLRAVHCPVLVLRGPDDRICPPDWAASLGRSETLPRGAHMVPWTQGSAVAERIAQLLGDPGTSGAGPLL